MQFLEDGVKTVGWIVWEATYAKEFTAWKQPTPTADLGVKNDISYLFNFIMISYILIQISELLRYLISQLRYLIY